MSYHTKFHIHHSVVSKTNNSAMSAIPLSNHWVSRLSRRKLQLACSGKRDVPILHRLVLVSNVLAKTHDDDSEDESSDTDQDSNTLIFPQPDSIEEHSQVPSEDEQGWLDQVLDELDDEAEVLVSVLDDEEDSCMEDGDDTMILCDSFFSICDCASDRSTSEPSSPGFCDLPFHAPPELEACSPSSSTIDCDSDDDDESSLLTPSTPSMSYIFDGPTSSKSPTESALFHDLSSSIHSLFDPSIPRTPLFPTCLAHHSPFVSNYC